jgi:group I intron endonuclease
MTYITRKYCLYTITCLVNNKVYVGVASWYQQRVCKHKFDLRNGIHLNCYLQQDYNLYGEKSMVYDIVNTYSNRHEAMIIEKYYTDVIFGLNKDYCYNILSGGENVQEQITIRQNEKLISDIEYRNKISKIRRESQLGKEYSYESKMKMRESTLGRKASDETKEKMSKQRAGSGNSKAKKVIDSNTGKIYGCLKDATNELGLNYDMIRGRINGYNKQETNLKWL